MPPLISVLLPTRRRISMLRSSLSSLLDRARDPGAIEILIAYDDDDDDSHGFFSGPEWNTFISTWPVTHRVCQVPRWGYRALHRYVNHLASQSQGKWIFFWNDDALMETQNWDDHVRQHQDFVGLLHITASNMPMTCSIFPLIHRGWIDLFGCISPINHADSWVSDVCRKAHARRVIPVTAFHDRFETSGNNRDETYEQKRYDLAHGSKADYHTPQSQRLREEWTERFRHYRTQQPLATIDTTVK
jgi:hypothetical protein